MALIDCPECGKEISDQALSCPSCGGTVEGGFGGELLPFIFPVVFILVGAVAIGIVYWLVG